MWRISLIHGQEDTIQLALDLHFIRGYLHSADGTI